MKVSATTPLVVVWCRYTFSKDNKLFNGEAHNKMGKFFKIYIFLHFLFSLIILTAILAPSGAPFHRQRKYFIFFQQFVTGVGYIMMRNWKTQWWIQDLLNGQTSKVEAAQCQILDCPGEGVLTQRGTSQPIIWPLFPKKCMKMKNFVPKGMGALPSTYPLDPPMPDFFFLFSFFQF